MTNKDQVNTTPVKTDDVRQSEITERAADQDPAALVHSLQVAITQINHNYEAGDELIPTHLLAPMEQARPGTVAEYAQVLLGEPLRRHSLDMHSVIQTYLSMAGNYLLAFGFLGATVYLADSGKVVGAVATALVGLAQMGANLMKKANSNNVPSRSDPAQHPAKRAATKGPKGKRK